MRPLRLRTARTVWLVVLWLALWGTVTPANLLSGVVVALAVQALPDPGHRPGRLYVRPLPTLHFVGWFAYKVVEASVVVAREVVTRQDNIHTGIVEVPLVAETHGMVTLISNAVGMIPGTITLEVGEDPPALFVHVLHLHDVDAVRAEVGRLEELAIRAFGAPAGAPSGAPAAEAT